MLSIASNDLRLQIPKNLIAFSAITIDIHLNMSLPKLSDKNERFVDRRQEKQLSA